MFKNDKNLSFDKTTILLIALFFIFALSLIHPKSTDWLSRNIFNLRQSTLRNIVLFVMLSYHVVIIREQIKYWKKRFLFNLQNGFLTLIGGNALLLTIAPQAGLHLKHSIPYYFVIIGLTVFFFFMFNVLQPTAMKLKELGFKLVSKQAEEYYHTSPTSVIFVFIYSLTSTIATCYVLLSFPQVIWY